MKRAGRFTVGPTRAVSSSPSDYNHHNYHNYTQPSTEQEALY